MSETPAMKKVCDWYIRRAALIGLFYCAIPCIFWFVVWFFMVPFREVYALRLVISIIVGGALAAYANRYGVKTWLIKHKSKDGPATVLDGIVIGGSVGIGIGLVPPLTLLISSTHPEEAKAYIILSYLIMIFIGAIVGGILASIGRKYLDTSATPEGDQSA